jgi:hypothetical protein
MNRFALLVPDGRNRWWIDREWTCEIAAAEGGCF